MSSPVSPSSPTIQEKQAIEHGAAAHKQHFFERYITAVNEKSPFDVSSAFDEGELSKLDPIVQQIMQLTETIGILPSSDRKETLNNKRSELKKEIVKSISKDIEKIFPVVNKTLLGRIYEGSDAKLALDKEIALLDREILELSEPIQEESDAKLALDNEIHQVFLLHKEILELSEPIQEGSDAELPQEGSDAELPQEGSDAELPLDKQIKIASLLHRKILKSLKAGDIQNIKADFESILDFYHKNGCVEKI